ncbi:MAG: hypothetical protein Q8N31_07275 [Reyranella sp.]|nr:hypothetical protein [Reyranella sp.]MDP3159800.1 hypothetical protein [Reyranella sp.]
MNRTLLAIALLGASAIVATGAQAQSSGPYPVSSPKGTGSTWTPSADEAYSKSLIQRAGYTGVSDLMRSPDGSWHGHALKENAKVDVAVDRTGRVTTN